MNSLGCAGRLSAVQPIVSRPLHILHGLLPNAPGHSFAIRVSRGIYVRFKGILDPSARAQITARRDLRGDSLFFPNLLTRAAPHLLTSGTLLAPLMVHLSNLIYESRCSISLSIKYICTLGVSCHAVLVIPRQCTKQRRHLILPRRRCELRS